MWKNTLGPSPVNHPIHQVVMVIQHLPITRLGGGLEHDFYDFPYIGNVIIPTDEFKFFRGVAQPPTSRGIPDVFPST